LVAELALAVLLLMSSFARAAIGAALVSCVLLCLGARSTGCAKGIAASLLWLSLPQPFVLPQRRMLHSGWLGGDCVNVLVQRTHETAGVLASRRELWGQTFDVISENPWFGSGYGTSVTTAI